MNLLIASATVAAAALAAASVAGAQGPVQTTSARKAADSWLSLVDSGDYAASWDRSAAYFRRLIPKEQWNLAAGGVREPLGKVKSRKLESATFTQRMPGAPDGEYVVIRYRTRFEHKADAIETVTPMREPDGSWKVAGYFVK